MQNDEGRMQNAQSEDVHYVLVYDLSSGLTRHKPWNLFCILHSAFFILIDARAKPTVAGRRSPVPDASVRGED
jgi:hypothetical protein